MSSVLTRMVGGETAAARIMADAWSTCYAALWQGDPAASAFAEWLAEFWDPELERPSGLADARGDYAAGGEIAWFDRDGWVSGHITGQRGGYLVPREDVLELTWTTQLETAA